MDAKKRIIVVGSGGGALGAAACLAKYGNKVLMYERGNSIGGAAHSIKFEGYCFDEGIHYLVDVKGKRMHIDELGEIFGINTEIAQMKGAQLNLIYKGEVINMLEIFPLSPSYNRKKMMHVYQYLSESDAADVEAFAKKMVEQLMAVIAKLNLVSFDDILLKLPYISLDKWLDEHTKSKNVIRFILDIANVNLLIPVESVKTVSTYAVLALFMGLGTGMFKYCYPVHPVYGGFGAFLEPYADYIKAMGGEIHLNTPVKKVHIEKGKATGVTIINDGYEEFIPADIVICNVSPQLATKVGIVDMKDFPSAYQDELKNKSKVIADGATRYDVQTVNVHIGLKKQVSDLDSHIVVLDDNGVVVGGIQNFSVIAPNAAPKGKHLLCLTAYMYKQPKDYRLAEKLVQEKFMPLIRKWIPDIDQHIDFFHQSFMPIPYAELNQQMFSSTEKFENTTPIPNFYWVGMYTGMVGADGAMVTGVRVAEKILNKKLMGAHGEAAAPAAH